MRVHYHVSAPFIGGAERQLEYLIKYLRRLDPKFEPSISVETPELKPWAQKLGYASVTRERKELFYVLERTQPQVFQFYTSAMAYRALLLLRYKPRVIEVIHNKNHFPGDPSTYPKDRTDIAVCVSPDAEAFIRRDYPHLNTIVVSNGVDQEKFFPVKDARSFVPVLGFAGRLCVDKGINALLEIATSLPCKLELVGEDFGGYARRQCENVTVFPHTDRPEDFYRRWWGFISASPHESFGLAIAEAMACGCVPVMLDCGGITGYLRSTEHGYITDNLPDLIRCAHLLVTPGVAQPKPMSISFSAELMATAYRNIYDWPLIGVGTSAAQVEKVIRAALPRKVEQPVSTRPLHPRIFRPVKERVKFPGGALGITPGGWYGVVRALAGCCDWFAEPIDAPRMIQEKKPKWVVLGCYQDGWKDICAKAHRLGAKVVATWHASHILNEFDNVNRTWMVEMFDAYKRGDIDFIATPHYGLARTWTELGYPTSYFPNVIDTDLKPVPKLPGTNIGILGSAQAWKNMECQIIAAGLIKDATIHVQELKHPEIYERLGLRSRIKVHPKTLSDAEYYKLLGGMTVNMCVSLSEVYSYLTAESFLMQTPVLTGSITPVLHSMLECGSFCIDEFEDPRALAGALRELCGARSEWTNLRAHMIETNNRYRGVCDEAIRSWSGVETRS